MLNVLQSHQGNTGFQVDCIKKSTKIKKYKSKNSKFCFPVVRCWVGDIYVSPASSRLVLVRCCCWVTEGGTEPGERGRTQERRTPGVNSQKYVFFNWRCLVVREEIMAMGTIS